MRDFTLKKYRELCRAIKENYQSVTVLEYLTQKPENSAIIRHDVDVDPKRALKMAKLENKLGISATYYFRTIPKIFKPEIIKKIHSMGHEIGYHYEVLDKAKGDYKKAIQLFEQELKKFPCEIKTCSMHGNPKTEWTNKDLWKKFNLKDLGLVGEVYLSIDYSEVMYFSDTGRNWSGKYSLKDFVPVKNPYTANTTNDLINLIEKKEMSELCISTHPKRWNDSLPPWLKELVFQSIKNVPKGIIKWTSR